MCGKGEGAERIEEKREIQIQVTYYEGHFIAP